VADNPALYFAAILALGIAAQWLAWRLRIPAIVLLLTFGFLLGYFTGRPTRYVDDDLLFPLVSMAVGLILFEGGLTLRFRDIRDTRGVVIRLVTIGLFVTWTLTALAAHWLLGLSAEMATLIGALLSISGPTVIGPLVRNIHLNRRIGPIVKWEGIVNDPIGAVAAALVFNTLFLESRSMADGEWIWGALRTLAVGVILGGGAAWALITMLRRFLVPDYLQNPVILAVVLLVFVGSNQLQHESGLVSVVLLGIAMANQRIATVKHVVEFKENLTVLLVSTLFIVLAANVDLGKAQLSSLGWGVVGFLLLLILVIRPLSVLAATLGSDLNWRERALLAWVHPRGIVVATVTSLLALELAATPFAREADEFVLVTYLTIVTTVVVYGLTLPPLARWLRLATPDPQGVMFAGASPLVRAIAVVLQDDGFPVVAVDTNHQNIAAARMAGLTVHFASIGSEFVRDEVDLGDVGRLLAMTPNDEVNTLAAMEFVDEFGRREVYQLAAAEPDHERRDRVPAYRRGRTLFARDATFATLSARHAAGAVVKKTQLTGNFTLQSFLDYHGPSAIVLFLVDAAGKLHVRTSDPMPSGRQYPKVIALVDPAPAAEIAEKSPSTQ
jgi:NhaP-type Na+/H+ or K+/H+ antiporter